MLALMKELTRKGTGCRWRWFGPSEDDGRMFFDRGAKRTGAHKSELVTLAVQKEKGAFARFPGVMTLGQLVTTQIRRVDRTRSLSGICRR